MCTIHAQLFSNYWVYYTATPWASNPNWARYNSSGITGINGSMSLAVSMPTFGLSGALATSAHYTGIQNGVAGGGNPVYYFMIVQSKAGLVPTVTSAGKVTKNGVASQKFAAPHLYFFGGRSDGDGLGTNTPAQTALPIAELYDATFHAQMTTFAWNELDSWKRGVTLTANAAVFPKAGLFMLMGQSFGGGAAVGLANELASVSGAPAIGQLWLFDPVTSDFPNIKIPQPPPNPLLRDYSGLYAGNVYHGVPGQYVSSDYSNFQLLHPNTAAVIDYYSSNPTENHFAPALDLPTGPITSAQTHYVYNHQEDLGANISLLNVNQAETAAMTHTSQTVNNQILTLDLWQWVEPYHFASVAVNPWAF